MNTHITSISTFAAADYNCGAYGAGSYDENNCQTTAGSPDTGVGDIAGVPYFVLGGVLIAIAIVLAIIMMHKKHSRH